MVKFTLQLAGRTDLDYQVLQGLYLFNDHLACGVCQISPSAPVLWANNQETTSHGPFMRCVQHLKPTMRPWPKPMVLYPGHGGPCPSYCEAPGCTEARVTLTPVRFSTRFNDMADTQWLCRGHSNLGKAPVRRQMDILGYPDLVDEEDP